MQPVRTRFSYCGLLVRWKFIHANSARPKIAIRIKCENTHYCNQSMRTTHSHSNTKKLTKNPLIIQSLQLESLSKSQIHSSHHSRPVIIPHRSNVSGNRIIITAKIFHCRVKYTISPEKDTLSRQITVSTTHINTINNSTNIQINHTIKPTNQITLDLFTLYSTPRLKFAPLKCNLAPVLVPNVRFTPV